MRRGQERREIKRKVEEQKMTNCETPCCSKNVKIRRQYVQDSKPTRPEVQDANWTEGENLTHLALFNGLILQKIFANIRTSFLLTSCSLVNKTWNAEARKFVRNHRICAAQNNRETTACEFLKGLDRLCGQMKQIGRIIPFNYVKIDFSKRCEEKSGGDKILYSNVISELKLKGLTISGSYFWDCEHHRPLLTLLKHKSREVQRLKVHSTGPFSGGFKADEWSPQFSQLEEFSIDGIYCGDMPWVEIERIQWLLKCAPKLKRISVGGLYRLRFVPKDILAHVTLHGRLMIQEPGTEEVNLLSTVADRASGLNELIFYEPPPSALEGYDDGNGENSEDESNEEDDESEEYKLAAEDRRKKYKSTMERLLQTAQQSLETIKTNTAYPLSQLCHPPLVNLSKLGLALRNEQDWNDITSINFERTMPRLKVVHMIVETEIEAGEVLYNSSTVRELDLELKNDEFNLRLLSALFPKVSVLNLLLRDYWPRMWARRQEWFRVPIPEVCESWPGLEELKIEGPPACLGWNYDTYFCGISGDEAGWLKEQDEEYLRKVHIVPIKPSLLTLPKLREFWLVEDMFIDYYDDPTTEPPPGFRSTVAQFLLFNRFPQLNVCLPVFKERMPRAREMKVVWF